MPHSHAQRTSRAVFVGVIFLTMMSLAPETAHAYIDPNTGGYAFQILFPIISAIAGIFLFFKNQALSLGHKIVRLFRKKTDSES